MIGGSKSKGIYTNLFIVVIVAMFVPFRLVGLALCKKKKNRFLSFWEIFVFDRGGWRILGSDFFFSFFQFYSSFFIPLVFVSFQFLPPLFL